MTLDAGDKAQVEGISTATVEKLEKVLNRAIAAMEIRLREYINVQVKAAEKDWDLQCSKCETAASVRNAQAELRGMKIAILGVAGIVSAVFTTVGVVVSAI